MEYLPPLQQQLKGGDKYHGATAAGYNAKRETDGKWVVEQRIIQELLSDLPAGTVVLDCPVGTGRFLPFYVDKGFRIVGMDKSADMLREAAKLEFRKQVNGDLVQGDILRTGLADSSVDVAVNCRITRWIIGDHGPGGIVQMLKEMQRVARQRIILTARVANHPYAVTEDLIRSALGGWRIARNEAGYVTDYRIIALERNA
jgi:ubiquinone/menaquinone biosynthesis C-methylase UbiE